MTPQEFGAALLLLGFDYYHATTLHYTHRYGLEHPVREVSFTENWAEVVWNAEFPWARRFVKSTAFIQNDELMATPELHNFASSTPGNLRYLLHLITTEQKEGAVSAP